MKRKHIAALVSSLLASSLSAAAEPVKAEQGVTQLKKVIVTVTRMKQNAEEVSRPIAVVERDEIDSIQPQSVAEVLVYEPNISVSGGPRANNQTVNIRGLSGNKILQTVDGVRQVFESGHRPSYFLDPELLQSVEAVKGPASTLWGSGALGGVVAQNSISASDLLEADQEIGGFVKTGYNDNNHQMSTTAVVAGRIGNVDWLVSDYYRDGNDLKLGNGKNLEGSASRDNGTLTKLEWQIDDAQSLAFNYRQSDVTEGVPSNGSAELNGTSNFLIDRDQQTRNASIDYRIDTRSPLIHSQITAYWNNIEMNESRVSDGRHDSTALDVLGLNINNLSMFGDIAVLYGIDGYTEEFRAERNGSNRPIPPDAETDVWGGFVQATIPLAKSWALELGTRYDYFATEAINLGQDRSDNDLSPSAALVWQSTDWLELTLRHDRAFRAPSSEEMYSTGTHFCMGPGSCNTFLPNPDLKAEQAANTELLAAMQFVNVLGGDLLNINASVFENRVDDFVEQIVEINAGNTTWVNVDEAKITGFEVSADYNINRFRAKLAYGQTRGEDNKTGEDLTNIPADTLTGDLSYRFWNNQLMTGFRVTYADDQNKTNYAENSDNKKYDSYSVADVYASWEPQSMKAFKVDLTVNNILDKHYSRAWEELDETGREMIVAARYKF